jgi:hypothetical protein
MLETKLIAKVTTDCLCENEDGTPLEGSCDGYCYEWQKEDVFELLGLWYVGNGIEEDDPILINAESIGWQNRSGFKWTTPMELDGALSLNGDFRIEWYLEDNELTARRWSHDEPMGTGLFTFVAYKGCDKCGEPVKADVHKEELGMCLECSNAYFDHSEEEGLLGS